SLRLEAYGLTEREREIANLLAQGLTTSELADRLHLSLYTVQDHLKAIFDKTSTRTRREFLARVFYEECLPRIFQGAPIDADGGFAPPPSARTDVEPLARH